MGVFGNEAVRGCVSEVWCVREVGWVGWWVEAYRRGYSVSLVTDTGIDGPPGSLELLPVSFKDCE